MVKKDQKGQSRALQTVSLTLIPGKTLKQILLEDIFWHKGNEGDWYQLAWT